MSQNQKQGVILRRFTMTLILAAVVAFPATRASGNLIHRYLMDDGSGTNVADSIGTNHGTASAKDGGTGGWTTGKFGGAFSSLTNGYVLIPSTGIPSAQGSFVQWINLPTSAVNWSNPLTTHIQDPDDARWMRHEVHSSGDARVYNIPNGGPGITSMGSTGRIRNNSWHQVVTTYDASANQSYLYVDGIERGSNVYNTTGVVTTSTWKLAWQGNAYNRCAGVYDNTAVYDNALSADEVNDLYYLATDGVTLSTVPNLGVLRHLYDMDQTNGAADQRDGYDGTVTGGSWVVDNPPQNVGGWQKTGTGNQHINIPMRVNLVEGTYEGWFKTGTSVGNWQNPLSSSIRDVDEAGANDSMRLEVANDLT